SPRRETQNRCGEGFRVRTSHKNRGGATRGSKTGRDKTGAFEKRMERWTKLDQRRLARPYELRRSLPGSLSSFGRAGKSGKPAHREQSDREQGTARSGHREPRGEPGRLRIRKCGRHRRAGISHELLGASRTCCATRFAYFAGVRGLSEYCGGEFVSDERGCVRHGACTRSTGGCSASI